MPPPFNIDQTKPVSSDLLSAYPANEQANRAVIEEWLSWLSDPATGLINPSVIPSLGSAIPTGTAAVWQQTNAPTGWTKVTTHNNKAFQLTTGTASSGGTVAFTTAFTLHTPTGTIGNTVDTGTVGGTAVSTSQIPSHTHTFTTNTTGDHSHGVQNGGGTLGGSGSGNTVASTNTATTGSAGAHTHTGTTAAAGSGATHTHTYTGNSHGHTFTGTGIDLRVQYVDFIIATKDA